jgi:hypothetical protein
MKLLRKAPAASNRRDKTLGRIIRFFEAEFWTESPFARLRRTIAALAQSMRACGEVGIYGTDRELLVALIMRRFLYGLISCTSCVSYFTHNEIESALTDWLIAESIPAEELQLIVRSTATMIYRAYGDITKGPLDEQFYSIPAPAYAADLVELMIRTMKLYRSLPSALHAFDALMIEESILERPVLARSLLRDTTGENIADLKRWLRSVRIFITTIQPDLGIWDGWKSINGTSEDTAVADT